MHEVLKGLDYAFPYLNDVLIASASAEKHALHLRTVFERLRQHGLFINPLKCRFFQHTVEFLSSQLSPEGTSPLPHKVEALNHP